MPYVSSLSCLIFIPCETFCGTNTFCPKLVGFFLLITGNTSMKTATMCTSVCKIWSNTLLSSSYKIKLGNINLLPEAIYDKHAPNNKFGVHTQNYILITYFILSWLYMYPHNDVHMLLFTSITSYFRLLHTQVPKSYRSYCIDVLGYDGISLLLLPIQTTQK